MAMLTWRVEPSWHGDAARSTLSTLTFLHLAWCVPIEALEWDLVIVLMFAPGCRGPNPDRPGMLQGMVSGTCML